MIDNAFLLLSLSCGIASVINYFVIVRMIGVYKLPKNSKQTITTTSIKHNKTELLQILYYTNSLLGAIFLFGIAHYYSITYTTILFSITFMVVCYWLAAITITNKYHIIAGVVMGASVVSLVLVFGLSLMSLVYSLGLFSLATFIAYLFMVTFSIRDNGYKMTLQLEKRFSYILSLWIIVIATYAFFDKIL